MALADLVDQPTLIAQLGAMGLTSAELALLPSLGAGASRAVRDYCGRDFTRGTYDELYSPGPGEDLVLRQYPVNAVSRLASGPEVALSVSNADAATNQRAVVAIASTGDVDSGLVSTGLTLTRWASGASFAPAVAFAGNPTIASLAAAINALGGGWQATAAAAFLLWPSADLRAPGGPQDALNGASADFRVHSRDLAFDLDAPAGIVSFGAARDDDPWSSPRWGPALSTSWGDTALVGRPGGVRAVYDAGYDTIPGPVVDATIEVAKARLERLRQDTSLASESVKDYAWTARPGLESIPPHARQMLHPYRRIGS